MTFKSEKRFRNQSHSNVGKLGDEKNDVSKKFQAQPTDSPPPEPHDSAVAMHSDDSEDDVVVISYKPTSLKQDEEL